MAEKSRQKKLWTLLKNDLTSLRPKKIIFDIFSTLTIPLTARAILSYLALAFSMPALTPLLTPTAKNHLAPFNITPEMVDHLAPNQKIHIIDGRTWHGKMLAYLSARPNYFSMLKGHTPDIFNSQIRAWAKPGYADGKCIIYIKENTYPDKNALFKTIALHEVAHCNPDNHLKPESYEIEQDATIKALETIKKFQPDEYRAYYIKSALAFSGAKDYDFSLSNEMGRFYTDAEINRAFNEVAPVMTRYLDNPPVHLNLLEKNCSIAGFPNNLRAQFVPAKVLRTLSPEAVALTEIKSKIIYEAQCRGYLEGLALSAHARALK